MLGSTPLSSCRPLLLALVCDYNENRSPILLLFLLLKCDDQSPADQNKRAEIHGNQTVLGGMGAHIYYCRKAKD